MTTPFSDYVPKRRETQSSGRVGLPSAPIVPSSIDGAPVDLVTPGAVEPESWSTLGSFLGNLAEMTALAIGPGFAWDSNLSFRENMAAERARELTLTEVAQAGKNLLSGVGRTIGFLADVAVRDPQALINLGDNTRAVGNIITSPIRSFGEAESAGAYIDDTFSSTIPGVVKGMLELFVEPTLTMATGLASEGGEIVPATSEEMTQGITTTIGNLAGASVYNRLAGTVAATRSAGRVSRMGTIARNISREAPAQAISGMAQEAIANPDEFTLESVINNIANPLVLATAVGGGMLRGRSALKKDAADWLVSTENINRNITTAVPSAKQVAVTSRSTFQQALASIDALTESSDWIEAGFQKIRKAGEGTFYVLDATAEQVGRIYDRYAGETVVVKPKIETMPKPVVQRVGGIDRVNVFFQNNFDALVYGSSDLAALSDQLRIPVATLKEFQKKLGAVVAEQPKSLINRAQIGKDVFKSTLIPEQSLPIPKNRPRVYVSKNGTMLATMQPLDTPQFKIFEESGFLPNEIAVFDGVEVIFKSAKNGMARVEVPGRTFEVPLDDLNHMADGTRGVWGKRQFEDALIDRALAFIEAKKTDKSTFGSLVERFADEQKIPAEAVPALESVIYNRARILSERMRVGPESPAEMKVRKRFETIQKTLEREQKAQSQGGLAKINVLGYRITPITDGYRLVNYDGRVIGSFKTIDELANFANKDFFTGDVPVLLQGNLPFKAMPIQRRQGKATGLVASFKGGIIGQAIRPIARRAEDLAELAGVPMLGVQIARGMEVAINSINAAQQGIFKPLMDRANRISQLGAKVSRQGREEVTKALQQMSYAEIREMIGPDKVLEAEVLFDFFKKAGGSDAVKRVFAQIRDGDIRVDDLKGPMLDAYKMLKGSIDNGIISDDGILRYIDALENGDNLTNTEWISERNWDRNTFELYKESKKYFEDARGIFGIEGNITGYAPWIQKWDGINSMYNKSTGPASQFIHELQRLGLTNNDMLVTTIDDLVYKYTKSGIHHKSPVAGNPLMTTGELLGEINKDIRQLAELGGEARDLEIWVANLKGIPDRVTANAQAADKVINGIFGTNQRGNAIDGVLDLFTLLKLGGRPILAARDVVTSFNLALGYGYGAAVDILKITPERMKRIESLSAAGELPQFTAEDILSRMGKTKLSKATDIGMNLSLQPQVYKAIAGNMYIHTFDRTVDVLKKAKGDMSKVIDELGDLLDSGSKPSQQYFLDMAHRDPVGAAKFLAARNAGNLAGRFGRLNNPLTWQTAYGRVFGQFGSWSVNAINTYAEMLSNSRSTMAALRKFTRMATFSTAAVVTADQALDLDLSKWVVNPLALIPGVGPAAGTWDDLRQSVDMIFSASEDNQLRGAQKLLQATEGFITPIMIKDLMKGSQELEETGSQYRNIMTKMGFKLTEEK
jgi:hypothetical protein